MRMTNKQQLYSVVSVIALAALVLFGLVMYHITVTGKRPGWGNLFGNGMPAAMVGGDGPQRATSTEGIQENGPKSFSSYDSYVNGPAGWLISFPHTFTLATQVQLGEWAMPTGTRITYDPTEFSGTNLSEAKVALATFAARGDVANCFPNFGEKPKPQKVVLNGITWYRNDASDAGAGNYYETETYVTTAGNNCYVISLLMHSTNLGNYPDNMRPKSFDKPAIEKIFNEMRSSFAWVQ